MEFADENQGNAGYLLVDDLYLSDSSQPHGVWTVVTSQDALGVYSRSEEWPFFDIRMGTRFVTPATNGQRYFRLEFDVVDSDDDQIPDSRDLCPDSAEAGQIDLNGNGVGDACDPCPNCGNVGLGKPTAASSVWHNNYHHRFINDGAFGGYRGPIDYWLGARRRQAWAEIDLRGLHTVCVVRWLNTTNQARYGHSTGAWRLTVFEGGVEAQIDEGADAQLPIHRWQTTILDECVPADRVRFYADSWNGDAGGLTELEVYGEPLNNP
jgi:hypothetical protein